MKIKRLQKLLSASKPFKTLSTLSTEIHLLTYLRFELQKLFASRHLPAQS